MKDNSGAALFYSLAAVACVLIIALAIVAVAYLHSGGKITIPVNSSLSQVSVSASGTAKGLPSMALVDLFVNATGNSTHSATLNLSSRIDMFNTTVSGYIGGNASLVKTQYYNVQKAYSNVSNSIPVYVASEYIEVTLPNVSKLSSFIVTITNVSGMQVQDISAELSDAQISQLRQVALQSAVANATSQARDIIGNATIVNTTVSVGSYSEYPYPIYAVASSGGPSSPPEQLYYNGTSSVYESIQATFYYKK